MTTDRNEAVFLGSDISDESANLFRAARKAMSPTTADRDAMRARLALKLGAGAAALSIATTTSKAAAGTAASGGVAAKSVGASVPLLAKILAPVVVVGAVGGTTVTVAPRVMQAHRSTTTTTATAPTTTTPAPVVNAPKAIATTTTSAEPPSVSVSVADLPPASRPHHGSAKKTEMSLRDREEEASLVAEIDAALRSGDSARALRLAEDHQKRFANGLLVEEREGARVLARCMSTPNSAAADRFLKAHPRSPMRARILAQCGTTTTTTSGDGEP